MSAIENPVRVSKSSMSLRQVQQMDYRDDDDDHDDDDLDVENDDFADASLPFEIDMLTEHHWHRRSVRDLVEMMSTPWLELNPEYQRHVVWTQDKMTKLINSLMSNYYIPPLIFNVTKKTIATGEEKYVRISIDGKQRLSSVREFVFGTIPCTDKHGRRWYFCDNGASRIKKRILPEKTKQKFMDLEFLCAEYSSLERKQEEDLFSRVQMGVPLTPAEKLRASSGPWQSFALQIERTYGELMKIVDDGRGRSFQLILQVFRQLINAQESHPKYSFAATNLKAFCDRHGLLNELFKLTARRVFHTYNEILKKHPEVFENHNYSHATRYSPIEFVGAAVLIYRYPERNVTMLSRDLLMLRSHLRKERQELRSNASVFNTIMDFIHNLDFHRRGAGASKVDNTQKGLGPASRKNPVGSAIAETEFTPTTTEHFTPTHREPPSGSDGGLGEIPPLAPPPKVLPKSNQEKALEPAQSAYPKFPPSTLAPVTFASTVPTPPLPQPQLSNTPSRAPVAPMATIRSADRFRAVRKISTRRSPEGKRITKRSRVEGGRTTNKSSAEEEAATKETQVETKEEEDAKIGPFSMDY